MSDEEAVKALREFDWYSNRFWSKVLADKTGCWVWTGSTAGSGYGRFYLNGRLEYAHRISCALLGKATPSHLEGDHLCRNRACVNPAHIEFVSTKVNILRSESPSAINSRRVACKRGHSYTYDAKGRRRRCAKCKRIPAFPVLVARVKEAEDLLRKAHGWMPLASVPQESRAALTRDIDAIEAWLEGKEANRGLHE